MDKTQIETLLIQRHALLAEIAQRQAYQTQLRAQVQAKIDALIPPELKEELAAIEAEFTTAPLQEQVNALKAEIEAGVLELGATVKAEGCGMAVYNKARVTWDSAGLEGASKLHPELLAFRKVGEPSVSFRDK